jgi:membrane protease YdiL (CAAX protease family)
MSTLKALVRKRPVLTYYVLAFAISWGGILIAIGGPKGIPGRPERFQSLLPLVVLAMLAGPSVAGLLMTALVSGRAGLRGLLSRLFKLRVAARWYAIALLTAPFLMAAIPLALSLIFPALLPGIFAKGNKLSLLLTGIAAGLGAGIFEELGWTGFAIPRLRLRYDSVTAGLIVGGLWGAWHFLVNFWSSGTASGRLSAALLLHSLLFSILILPAFRLLMVWVYDLTGSLFVAMLMHASLTAGNVILVPAGTGLALVTWSLVLGAALWVVVARVAADKGRGPRRGRSGAEGPERAG